MGLKQENQGLHNLIQEQAGVIEKLWDVLQWIDTFEPETTAAAEDHFKFDLRNRMVLMD